MPEEQLAPPRTPADNPGPIRLEASGKNSVVVWNAVGTRIYTGVLALSWPARLGLAAGLALLLTAAATTIYIFLLKGPDPPPGGSINIGIAQLVTEDPSGQSRDVARSTELAQQVADLLKTRAAASSETNSIAVWPPSWTGRIDSAQAAARRASDIKADVLVYGTLVAGPDTTRVLPRYYVTSTLLPGAEELAGEHQLGADIVYPGDIGHNQATFDNLKLRLANRVSALQHMIDGLDAYQVDDLALAATAFDLTEKDASWQGQQGKEILYLFAGFTAGKRNDLDSAARYFETAQTFESTRLRAELGAAEVLVTRYGSQQNCTRDQTDSQQLQQAASEFTALIDGPPTPVGLGIRPKAHFGLGQIYLCLSQAQLEDDWDTAADEFRAVIAAYEQGDASIKDLAAESHSDLGFIDLPLASEGPGAQRDDKYRIALVEYQNAADLSDAHPARQAYFLTRVGELDARLGMHEQSEAAYSSAIALDPSNAAKYQEQLEQVRMVNQ